MECHLIFGFTVESFVYGSFGVLSYCSCIMDVTSMTSVRAVLSFISINGNGSLLHRGIGHKEYV